MVVPLAQGDPAGARRGLSLRGARSARASARSDKPTDIGWYSYDRHTELAASLLEDLDLRGATIVVHDWGGPIGLRLAVEHAERIERIVILDTGLFTGHQRMSDAWTAFRDFVERTEDLPIGFLVRGACKHDPGDEVIACLRRALPGCRVEGRSARLPAADPARARGAGRRGRPARAGLAARGQAPEARAVGRLRPDPAARTSASASPRPIGAPPPRLVEDASHFLQEDQGPAIGALIADWLTAG